MKYLIIFLVLISCNTETPPEPKPNWLIGTWESKESSYEFKENGKGRTTWHGNWIDIKYEWEGHQTIWIYIYDRGSEFWFYDKSENQFRLCAFNDTVGVIYNRK